MVNYVETLELQILFQKNIPTLQVFSQSLEILTFMSLPEQENNISSTLLDGRSRALVCKVHVIEKESRPQQNSSLDEYLRQKTNCYKVNNYIMKIIVD